MSGQVPRPQPCQAADCGKLLDFARPEGGGPEMPVDHDSAGDPKGRLEVWRDPGGQLRYRALKRDEEPAPGRLRGMSHFGTCSQPARFRRAPRVCPR